MGQMVMETKIDYLSFINTICKMVKEMLGDEYQVQIHKVTKNNSLELDSLLVLQKGRDFAPNIYLHPTTNRIRRVHQFKKLLNGYV